MHWFRRSHFVASIPLFGNGGAGVFRIQPNDQNLNSLLEMFFGNSSEPVMVQAYLPAVRNGDKRVILVNGKPVGAVNRIPNDREARSNFHVGGTATAAQLTERDKHICDTIGPELKRRGLLFVGIDIIGDYLTEINVTSPTGIKKFSDCPILISQRWRLMPSNSNTHFTQAALLVSLRLGNCNLANFGFSIKINNSNSWQSIRNVYLNL